MTDQQRYESVLQKYGELYTIEKQVGCEVDLRLLDDKQFVCYGGKNFYYLLTPKKRVE